RKVVRDLDARFRARRDRRDLDLGMGREDPQQLHARVTGPPDDSDLDQIRLLDTTSTGIQERQSRLEAAFVVWAPGYSVFRLSVSRPACGVAPCAGPPSCARPRAHRA